MQDNESPDSRSRKDSRLRENSRPQKKSSQKNALPVNGTKAKKNHPKKRSYKEQRQLHALPAEIERLEAEITALEKQMADPDFYLQDYSLTQPLVDELANKQVQLEQALQQWVELES